MKHCRSAHPLRRAVVLTRDDEDLPSNEAASGSKDDDETGDGRKTHDLSSLRNITKPTSSKLQTNSSRAKNSDKSVFAEKNKTTNTQLSSVPSSECLSDKDATNDDSLDESDDTDNYESSDEYLPPSSKKKSVVSRSAQPRGDGLSNRSAPEKRSDMESGTGIDDDSMNTNIEEDQISLTETLEDPTCDHIPCETIFAINRTTYRPVWQSQPLSDREVSNTPQPGNNLTTTVQVKTEPVDDYEYQSAASTASVQAFSASVSDRRREIPIRAPVTVSSTNQRQFYCVYCGLTSRWNKRDVRLHVMHVHVGVRAFSCGHCGFGNSKNRAIVRSHCAKSHPGRKMLLIDNEPVFEAIDSIQDQDNLITIAFTASDGSPLLTIEELDEYLSSKGIKFRAPTTCRKTLEPKAVVPDPETVRETIRNSVSNQNQQQGSVYNKSDETQLLETSSRESLNDSAELTITRDQMEELNCQWKCRQCDFRDSGFIQVENHIVRQHLQLKPYSCPRCHRYFSSSEDVLSHIDEDHAGCERQVVSTADAKSSYIRRNMQCIPVDVESNSSSLETEFQADNTSCVQFRSDNRQHENSNSKDAGLEKDTAGVSHKSSDEEHVNNVHSFKQVEPLQTRDASPAVKNSVIKERDPSLVSNNVLSSSQEEHRLSDSLPQTSSSAEEEQTRNESRNDDESVKSVDDVPELPQMTDESLGDNRIDVCNQSARSHDLGTSDVDLIVSNDLPTSVEERGSLGDSAGHTTPPNNLSVPSATCKITRNEGNGDSYQVANVNSDASLVSGEEQDSFNDVSVTGEHTEERIDASVLSKISSDTATNERNVNSPSILAEEQLSLRGSSSTDERNSNETLPVTNSYINPSEGGSGSRMTSYAEHDHADALPMLDEKQRSFKDSSCSNKHAQQLTDTPMPSTTLDAGTETGNSEVLKCIRVEEIAVETLPVSSQEGPVITPMEEHAKQLSSSPPPQTEMETEAAHDEINESNVEDSDLPSNQILGTDSNTDEQSRPLVNAASRDESRDDRATANPPEPIVEKDVEPLTDAASRPSVMSSDDKPNNYSAESFGDKPFPDATMRKLNSEDPADCNRPRATDRELRSERLSEDDGLSSDSSSSSEDSSTWRCDDCTFVATSESLLVAHRRSRQQYRCLYCPDFLHSSVVHMRHHCLTRHPGKPISYKHTVIPCSEIKSIITTLSGNPGSKVPANSGQRTNTQVVTQPKNAETSTDTVTTTKPGNERPPDSSRDEESNEGFCLDLEESSNDEESDNSEDEDWDEYEPVPKKSKMVKRNVCKTPKDADPPTAGPQGTIVCDICNAYNTTNSTVMRHHVMSHLQYYPYFCPHCNVFRSVRSFPIIKHIRMKHRGKAECFECNPDPEMEKKVRESCHRVKSNQKDHKALAEEAHGPQPPKPMETKVASSSKLEEREEVVATAAAVGLNKNRKILYKCKMCGLKTHLRGDFRHHIMRELQYKPFK